MGSHDWYRCTKWSEEEETQFFERIKRSKGNFHRAQYGRIQALYLEETNDEDLIREAIKLLKLVETDWYEETEMSACYNQLASCYIALGDFDNTIKYYEKCMESEKKFSNIKTSVNTDFSAFVIKNSLKQFYGNVVEMLEKSKDNNELVTIDDMFMYYATRAIVLYEDGNKNVAIEEAKSAMELLDIHKSQFKNHARFGIVNPKRRSVLIDKLSTMLDQSSDL